MVGSFKLKSPLGRSYSLNLGDVRRAKEILHSLGYYAIPDYGLTEFPDESLFEGIERFQSDFGLRRDGVMKPGGETETALNHLLGRRRVRNGQSKINAERLFGLFDRFSNNDPRDRKCQATGTCDNIL